MDLIYQLHHEFSFWYKRVRDAPRVVHHQWVSSSNQWDIDLPSPSHLFAELSLRVFVNHIVVLQVTQLLRCTTDKEQRMVVVTSTKAPPSLLASTGISQSLSFIIIASSASNACFAATWLNQPAPLDQPLAILLTFNLVCVGIFPTRHLLPWPLTRTLTSSSSRGGADGRVPTDRSPRIAPSLRLT